MESSAITRYSSQKSNKRVFPGSSSASMEPEVIEIAPPSADRSSKSKTKSQKQKEVVYHEIIDVDMDEDRNDVVFIEGKVEPNKKRKRSMGISIGPSIVDASQSQTSKKIDSNTKGKDVAPQTDTMGLNLKSLQNFLDLDDYVSQDEYTALQAHFDTMDIPTGIEASIPWLSNNVPFVQGNSTYSNNISNNAPFVETPQKIHHQNMPPNYTYNQPGYVSNSSSSFYQYPMNTGYPVGVEPSLSMYPMGDVVMDENVNGGKRKKSSSVVGSSSSMSKKVVVDEDVLKKYESFKKFDTVVDHSDHHYATQRSAMFQPPKNWAKKIQDEWRILEKDLPDTIFVRAYESRMDLLRAVIIGAEGTPYHDGLFFFDVCFTSTYPNSPPLVHYHSGGLRINPNLYNCGKVCLSLLNTWTGGHKERWVPGTSTMLQVLVSIQGLILNAKPYFNEPGYANSSGSLHGEKRSLQYNENTLILSLKTMIYTMKKPPKNFEDLVTGHFRNRVRDILMACKAYTEGVQVGCLVRGGVQDVDEGDDSCSDKFKADVAACVKTLVGAFKKLGAKEAEEFSGLTVKKSRPPRASAPAPAPVPAHPFAPAHPFGPGLPTPTFPAFGAAAGAFGAAAGAISAYNQFW